MRIKRVFFETDYAKYDVTLPDHPLAVFMSENATLRKAFVVSIEKGLFIVSDDPWAFLVKNSLVLFDENPGPEKQSTTNKELDIFNNHQQYQEHVLEHQPNLVKYMKDNRYSTELNGFLEKISGGRFKGLRCSQTAGLVVEHQSGRTSSVFSLAKDEIEWIKYSSMLTDLTGGIKFQIISHESIGLLDSPTLAIFAADLRPLLHKDAQVLLVGDLFDVLKMPTKDIPVVSIDACNHVDSESEAI